MLVEFRICDGAAELVGAIKKFSGPTSEFAFAKKEMEIQEDPPVMNCVSYLAVSVSSFSCFGGWY